MEVVNMKKKCLMSFRIVKTKNNNGREIYGLELSNEDGSIRNITFYPTIEKLVDGIYDYFDPELNYS